MIKNIEIAGLKRFKKNAFDMAPLTVLTGLNGSGKTSFLHAILLAVEASVAKTNSLSLNGPFGLELGTAGDVLNWHSTSPIEILTKEEGRLDACWKFGIPSDDALFLSIDELPKRKPIAFSAKPRTFTYLSAERLGPRGYTLASPLPETDLEVGFQGEYSAHVLSVLGDKLIEQTERTHPLHAEGGPRLLKYELEAWLSEIARPIEVNGVRTSNAAIAELEFRSPGATWVKSTNMGFGITNSLPIILAGLIAKPGSLLVVENPEAHLHPAGQSRMGVFLAWLAGRGVQTVVETHSDHVVNGIRRAIAEHRYLDHLSAVLHWLDSNEDDGLVSSTKLTVSASGSVSNWPKGFFDQYQTDVASLGRIRRKRRVP